MARFGPDTEGCILIFFHHISHVIIPYHVCPLKWGSSAEEGEAARPENDNSFLFADNTTGEAWLLDTAGRQWAAVRLTSGFR